MARRQDPLDSGMTTSGGSADPISGQFSKIRNLIGASPPASTSPPSPTGSTGFTAGPNSSDILRQGINLIGGTGVNTGTVGSNLLGEGVNLLGGPAAFYSDILSGDPNRITQALSPTAANISQRTLPLIQQAQQNMPRGGFSASTVAELPFSEAAQTNEAALGLQPAAAAGLTGIGTNLAGIGQGEQQLSLQALQQMINAALGKMGVTTGITGNLANVGQFLQGII